jgi:hypothetical protein
MDLWHIRNEEMAPGSVVPPGRWGSVILAVGAAHSHFFRECLLELWRVTRTQVLVSRLNCAFVFESLDEARASAAENPGVFIYRVDGLDSGEEGIRTDMLWLTWMAEPNATFDRVAAQCGSYWSGRSTADVSATAQPTWERLFAGGLRVLERID